jgi:hypothetical protein
MNTIDIAEKIPTYTTKIINFICYYKFINNFLIYNSRGNQLPFRR